MSTLRRDVERLKELRAEQELKTKWHQNKLKTELDSHKVRVKCICTFASFVWSRYIKAPHWLILYFGVRRCGGYGCAACVKAQWLIQETKTKLDEANKKLKQAQNESETMKKDYQQMIKQYQVSEK